MAGRTATGAGKLIRYIAQNDGRLANNKRKQFVLIGDETIIRAETQAGKAFATHWKRPRPKQEDGVSSRVA